MDMRVVSCEFYLQTKSCYSRTNTNQQIYKEMSTVLKTGKVGHSMNFYSCAEELLPHLLNSVSSWLHIVCGALKVDFKSTIWEFGKFLKEDIYCSMMVLLGQMAILVFQEALIFHCHSVSLGWENCQLLMG